MDCRLRVLLRLFPPSINVDLEPQDRNWQRQDEKEEDEAVADLSRQVGDESDDSWSEKGRGLVRDRVQAEPARLLLTRKEQAFQHEADKRTQKRRSTHLTGRDELREDRPRKGLKRSKN